MLGGHFIEVKTIQGPSLREPKGGGSRLTGIYL